MARATPARPVVLLADPVYRTRELLTVVFGEEMGARVVPIDGPDELLVMAREVRPHLIVLELDARHENGLDVVARLKSEAFYAHVPIMAFTAWGQTLTCDDARAAGCDECVPKPFDLDDVLARAAVLLARQPPRP